MQYHNKNFLVYGVSKSGIAACAFLKKLEANVFFYDDNLNLKIKATLEEQGCVSVKKGQLFGLLQDIYCLVVSPGICLDNPVVEMCESMGIAITNEVELSHPHFNVPMIAVTGTNGKSTTSALIHHVLSKSRGKSYLLGNFGTPLAQKALEISSGDSVVLEVSSYQLEVAKTLTPQVAVFTNIAPDHIARHKTLQHYFDIKASMFLRQTPWQTSILNADDEAVSNLSKDLKSKVYFFSTKKDVKGAYIKDDSIYFCDGDTTTYIMQKNDIKLLGEHNLQNVLACVAACCALSVSEEDIAKNIAGFLGLEHRLEYVRELSGKHFINDSKATNIASTLSAVFAVNSPTVLLLGGSDKGEDFKQLFLKLPQNIVQVVLFGDTRHRLLAAATQTDFNKVVVCQTMTEAIYAAMRYTPVGGNVLLSPSCPSFDAFSNFEERGAKFKEVVLCL